MAYKAPNVYLPAHYRKCLLTLTQANKGCQDVRGHIPGQTGKAWTCCASNGRERGAEGRPGGCEGHRRDARLRRLELGGPHLEIPVRLPCVCVLCTKCDGTREHAPGASPLLPTRPSKYPPGARKGSGQRPSQGLTRGPTEKLGKVFTTPYPGPFLSHSVIHHSKSC